MNYTENWKYADIGTESLNQVTTMVKKNTIQQIQKEKYRGGTPSLIILEEDYILAYSGMAFDFYNSYAGVYNEMLLWMESNGVMAWWRQRFLFDFAVSKAEDIGPQVLTMDHLKVGFLICLIPVIVSFIALIGELTWSKLCKFSQRVVEKNQTLMLISNESPHEHAIDIDEDLDDIDELVARCNFKTLK